MSKIVFFDLETSGLDPQKHEIIQIAACAVEDWEIIDEFECKVEFDEERAGPEALELNHYDREVWGLRAINQSAAWDKFDRFIQQHKAVQRTSKYGRPYLVARMAGHRSQFDMDFLRQWYLSRGTFQPTEFIALDTLQLAMWYDQVRPGDEPENYKLATLCKHYDIELAGAHDALVDVKATVELAKVLVRNLQS